MAGEAWKPKHQKTREQQNKDRAKLKQVALLWWAQKIYEQAQRVTGDAYVHNGAANQAHCYKDVIGVLADTVAKLRAIDCEHPKRPLLGEALVNARMDWGLKDNPDGNNQVRLPENTAAYQPDCESDSDCPEDYICDDGAYCVYLFPDLP
jgi:hypothetical protein